ncbi:chorion class B protein B.L1 [Manduca sexta]|uniref:chorion class B protein B.L1 n=1 Tax=Manduca sexta TaxID=7130 RepID=UPI00188FB784|nr:chorion class B protein B.L1 [Manduca sexta]
MNLRRHFRVRTQSATCKMVSKALFLLSVQTLLIKCALSQCFGRGFYGAGLGSPYGFGFGGYDGWGYGGWGYGGYPAAGWAGGWGAGLGFGGWGLGGCGGYGGFGGFGGIGPGIAPATGLAGSFGGGLAVTSASPIAPTGLVVTSENAIEGAVAVAGNLPFLGAVATDGAFPSAGAGAVAYGCGDGAVGIAAEAPVAGFVGPAIGYAGGCGCGVY